MRQRLLRFLRIAVTAVSLLVCGLLIGLWVRSYTTSEVITRANSHALVTTIGSQSGIVWLARYIGYHGYSTTGKPYTATDWTYHSREVHFEKTRFQWKRGFMSLNIVLPHWFLVTIFATIAAVPWIKWRFSLRKLLIVLTLFAVFFGAIAMSI